MITLEPMKASLEQQLQEVESLVLLDLQNNVLSQDDFEDLIERRDRLRLLVSNQRLRAEYGLN